jgi:uncharacterized glyoxalase superfamily protein PhnB
MGHDSEDGQGHQPHEHGHGQAQADGDFTNIKPILNVANVAASLTYYTEVLGFSVEFAWGDDAGFAGTAAPTFAEVRRGCVSVMLAQNAQGGGEAWVYVDVPSAAALDALHTDYAARGARIAAAPQDKPWNRREMLVEDPDGHTLRLGAPLEHHHGH